MKDIAEFIARLDETTVRIPEAGCWIWMLGTEDGYGRIRIGDRMVLAHRISYAAFSAPIPEKLCVLHECDVRPCVNPNHLFLGTNMENVIDKIKKGRHWTGFQKTGEQSHRAVLTREQVVSIINDSRAQRVIANEHGVTQSAISDIKTGKSWPEFNLLRASSKETIVKRRLAGGV
jgi:hypothetical protein